MPFTDILKRRKTSEDKNQTGPPRDEQSPVKKISEVRLPLEGFEFVISDEVDNIDHDGIQLVTCLEDILQRNVSLGYFIQYLESKNQDALIKFWMDVSSFKVSNIESKSHTYFDNQVSNCFFNFEKTFQKPSKLLVA